MKNKIEWGRVLTMPGWLPFAIIGYLAGYFVEITAMFYQHGKDDAKK